MKCQTWNSLFSVLSAALLYIVRPSCLKRRKEYLFEYVYEILIEYAKWFCFLTVSKIVQKYFTLIYRPSSQAAILSDRTVNLVNIFSYVIDKCHLCLLWHVGLECEMCSLYNSFTPTLKKVRYNIVYREISFPIYFNVVTLVQSYSN